jgi:tRNA (adenine22-N1)-methyltransferase
MDHVGAPLSPRLAALCEAIDFGSRVADIGSDHGLLPLRLASSHRASYCLVTEKTARLLGQVARPPADAAWANRLAFRSGDGLAAIRSADRIDTVVMAGLGARTIVRLLGAPRALRPGVRRLVLQPRSEPRLVRSWLASHGFRPVVERLTEERGRWHLTLAAERGDGRELYTHALLSPDDLLAAGPLLARSGAPEVARYWLRERERWASIVAGSSPGPGRTRALFALARAERVLAATSTPGG